MADVAEPGIIQGTAEGDKAATDPARVFISYSSPDADAATEVCGALERRPNLLDAPRDVVAGELYADAIVRAIDAAAVVLLVLSRHAAASPHVVRKIERARSKRCAVVSLRSTSCR